VFDELAHARQNVTQRKKALAIHGFGVGAREGKTLQLARARAQQIVRDFERRAVTVCV
jgi:hypothetical protein